MTGDYRPRSLGNLERTNESQLGRNGYHSVTSTETTAGTYDGTVYEYIEADEETVCTFTNSLTGIQESGVTLTAGRYRYGLFKFDDITVTSGKLICYLYKQR